MRALVMLALLVGACGPDVREEIRKANYCTVAADCGDAGSACPYGCNVLVNKSEVASISALLQSSEQSCVYDCAQLTSVACENQVCVAKY